MDRANNPVIGCQSSERSSCRHYQRVIDPKTLLTILANRPSSALLRKTEHIIGESVSAITPDTITEPASVNANSRNSEPVRPPRKPIGAYTAPRVLGTDMTAPTLSRPPFSSALPDGRRSR